MVKVFCGLLDGAGKAVKDFKGAGGVAVVAHRVGFSERNVVLVVAGALGRFITFEGFGVTIESKIRLAEVEMSQRAAIGVRQSLHGVAVAANQVLADAESG